MSSICYGGKLRMKVDEDHSETTNLEEYPRDIPKVYIDAHREDYYPQVLFSWGDDSVAVVRDTSIVEYTQSSHFELQAEDENGNIIWVDGKTAPYEGCWGGKYLGEYRCAQTYSVVEYDLNSLVKKTYKVIADATSEFDWRDVDRIMELYGEEEFCRDFTIRDRKVQRRVQNGKANDQC